ncbi:MAG: hypothetical protein JWM27_3515 [Gemmatimonadetes bacterium]|nr:hypothetical protein [Gemmatimonadota bacterium]
MRKLRLDLEDLNVETFETAEAGRGRGTVLGLRMVGTAFCDTADCPDSVVQVCPDTGWAQCGYSYGGTCGASPPETFNGCGLAPGAAAAPGGGFPYDCV